MYQDRPSLIKLNNFLNLTLKILISLSLIILLSIRIYAIYYTVPIVTWDDKHYRHQALDEASKNSTIKTVRNIFLPNSNAYDGGRTKGYQYWLALGRQLSLSGDYEETWQLVNLFSFVIQGLLVFAFSLWATSDPLISGTLSFIYLSSPLIFGLNRWVMTENFVFPSLIIFSFLPAWLINRKNTVPEVTKIRAKEIIYAGMVAWIMGVCLTAREYATPSFILLSVTSIICLAYQKRWWALGTFFGIISTFILSMSKGWIVVIKSTLNKSGVSQYFHPFKEFIPHIIFYAIGLALTTFMVVFMGIIIVKFISQILGKDKNILSQGLISLKKITGLQIFWLANLALIPFYSLAIVSSENRAVRIIIPLMMTILASILIGIKILFTNKQWLNHYVVKIFLLILIVTSWSSLYYELFIAFEGGKNYAHPAYDLERYNHSLHLRPLTHPDDMHVR